MGYLDDVFGERGYLASALPGYRLRPGQRELAELVDATLREGGCALAEGPTGTGKSLAYGVPAVYHAVRSERRVVIATANIALQQQLTFKDLPFLEKVLPWRFTHALLKGRNNYLCLDRLGRGAGQLALRLGDRSSEQLAAVMDWAAATEDGDMAELPFVPLAEVRNRVTVTGDDCKGSHCSYRETCYYERVKRQAMKADIIVTNYHLLFSHLALLEQGASILPEFSILILDEAHEAADIARRFFGFSLSNKGIDQLAVDVARVGAETEAETVRNLGRDFFVQLGRVADSEAYRCRLREPGYADGDTLCQQLADLATDLDRVANDEDKPEDLRADAANMSRRVGLYRQRAREALALDDDNKVYWIGRGARRDARLEAIPIEVGTLLQRALFPVCKSIVLTSATLTTGGTFDFVRRELGVPDDARELAVASPFDHWKQTAITVPDGLPLPRDPGFLDAVVSQIQEVIDACDGRTLGLFTSYKALRHVAAGIDTGGRTLLCQGDASRRELIERFRSDIRSILLGTASFWTGVDVPGESLSALVIDKLPFPRPDEPIVDAIAERDPRAFDTYLVPRMIMTLRQGIGRLIRTESDRGIIVLLDRRILGTGYALRARRSLPRLRRLPSIAAAAAWLHG